MHYTRWRSHGDPLDWGRRAPTPAESLKKRGVLDEATGCIIWTGGLHKDGYGSMGSGTGGSMLAHKFAWEQANGPVPGDLVVDHRCRNRACVNVDHLRVVPQVGNTQNRGTKGRGKSGIRGVWWSEERGKWTAGLRSGGKTVYLGAFDDPEEAGEVAKQARLRLMPFTIEEAPIE